MGWRHRRTKTCSYCHDEGHNVRTCTKVRRDARIYNEPRAQDKLAKVNENIRNRVETERTCGYCAHSGHNKKTCPKKVQDNIAFINDERQFRGVFVNACKTLNFGIGTLIKHTDYNVGIVVGFQKDLITSELGDRCVNVLFPGMHETNTMHKYTTRIPCELYNYLNRSSYWDAPTIVSKTTSIFSCPELDDEWLHIKDPVALLTKCNRL